MRRIYRKFRCIPVDMTKFLGFCIISILLLGCVPKTMNCVSDPLNGDFACTNRRKNNQKSRHKLAELEGWVCRSTDDYLTFQDSCAHSVPPPPLVTCTIGKIEGDPDPKHLVFRCNDSVAKHNFDLEFKDSAGLVCESLIDRLALVEYCSDKIERKKKEK